MPAEEPPADPRDLTLPREAPCFPIAAVRVEGTRLDEFGWLQSYLDQYRNRCIGREGINRLVKRGTALLIERGLVTSRIGIPEQDLSSGTLRLVLVPGVIRAIRVVGDGGSSWRSAFPARPGDLLDLRDLEQGLEQFKRLPSQDADMQIVPGQEPGESDVVVTLKRTKPWRLVAGLDDSGAKATGRLQASLNFAWDNPLSLNDLLTVGINGNARHEGPGQASEGRSLSYSVPWGNWLFSLGASRYSYRQTVQGVHESFVYSGSSEQTEAGIRRVIHRSQAGKTSLQLRVIHRNSDAYIEDAEIETQRRNTTAAEAALIHRHYLGRAQVDLALAHRQGVPWFSGQGDPAGRLPQSPTYRYALDTLDIGASVPLAIGPDGTRWLTAVRGQASHSPLYATEFISIGGRYTVRGFDGEQTLAAERGEYWRNEIEFPLAASQAFYLALDCGHVSGPSAAVLAGRTLVGTAVGLRGTAAGFSYEVFAGWALRKPDALTTARPAMGAQIFYQF